MTKVRPIFAVAFFLASLAALAYPVDENGELLVSIPLEETCRAKGDVVAFVYEHRSEGDQSYMLEKLEKDWNDVWSQNENIKYATYVDMQRVIRDAYRKDANGEFIRECCTEEVVANQAKKEIKLCLLYLEY